MVSTYLSYNLINRDLKGNLDRIKSNNEVSREQKYYDENIGKVKTVDELVDNYRLFSYAMKAHGLEDMTYAKAFMKKVLESDLTDTNSFANRLSDDRYRKFAASFQFTDGTAVAQTNSQVEDVIDAYKQSITDEGDAVAAENGYYKATIGSVTSVDQLLNNERMRDYVLKAYGVDSPYWSKDFLTKVLTSDVTDPASYVNTLTTADAAAYKRMATDFNFNASGTLDAGVQAQDASQTTSTVEDYTFTVPARLVPAGAQLNKEYFESKIGTITNVDDLVNDSRLLNYVKVAYGLEKVTLKSTIKNILTSDLSDPSNYATTMGGSSYETLTKAFNFATDGSVAAGGAQNATQTATTSSNYMASYDDDDAAADDDLYSYYKNYIGTIDSVDELRSTGKIYNFVLTAFGFDQNTSKKVIDDTLKSDLTDPKSFANKQKDDKYRELASAFNFDEKGDKAEPLLAQSQQMMQQVAKDYVIKKTRFGHDDDKDAATKEASAYTEAMQNVKTVSDFLGNSKLVNFVLESKGIDPKSVDKDFMKKLFASDLNDPKSFANQQTDHRFSEIVASFNFDADGNIGARQTGIQDRYGEMTTDYLYLQQTLETETGEDSEGARLALYFKRMAPSLNSAYDILGDTALLTVFRTTYELPQEMSSMDIDKQKALVDKYLKLEDLQDPDKLEKFITRFTSMYDLQNDTEQDPIMSLLSGTSGSISADTLLSIAQLKA